MIAFKEYLLDMMDVRIDVFPEMACSLPLPMGTRQYVFGKPVP